MIRTVNRLLAPLRTRIANMLARAVVRLVDDSQGVQRLQLGILDGETRDGVERVQEYGFTSVPLAGAEAVVVFVGGRRDHGLVVALDDRAHRPTGLEPGEVSVYHHAGPAVLLKAGRIVATAPELRLGSDAAVNFVAIAHLVTTQLTALKTAIGAAPTNAGDGGAAFKASLVAALAAWPGSVESTKVKAE